ncbi:MAG: hypothetical protein WBG67_11140, partial [Thermoanaerobaculia bacterium]
SQSSSVGASIIKIWRVPLEGEMTPVPPPAAAESPAGSVGLLPLLQLVTENTTAAQNPIEAMILTVFWQL